MDTFTLYDTVKNQCVDSEITIRQFIDYYLTDIENLDENPFQHRKGTAFMKLTHMGRSQEFNYKNFYFVKN